MSWTKSIPAAAQTYLEQNRLDEVECVIGDLPGIARGKAVPAAKWEKQDFFHLAADATGQTRSWARPAGPHKGNQFLGHQNDCSVRNGVQTTHGVLAQASCSLTAIPRRIHRISSDLRS